MIRHHHFMLSTVGVAMLATAASLARRYGEKVEQAVGPLFAITRLELEAMRPRRAEMDQLLGLAEQGIAQLVQLQQQALQNTP